MSKIIDPEKIRNPELLTEEERLYLQDRGQLPSGADPVRQPDPGGGVGRVSMGENVGDVGTAERALGITGSEPHTPPDRNMRTMAEATNVDITEDDVRKAREKAEAAAVIASGRLARGTDYDDKSIKVDQLKAEIAARNAEYEADEDLDSEDWVITPTSQKKADLADALAFDDNAAEEEGLWTPEEES